MANPIVVNAKLRLKRDALSTQDEALKLLREKQEEILTAVEAVEKEEDLEGIQAEAEKLDGEIEEAEEKRGALETEIKTMEETLVELNRSAEKQKEVRNMIDVTKNGQEEKEVRGLIDYLNSRGEKRDGITTTDVGAIIPKQIIYNPQDEVKTTYDLSQAVDVVPVSTAGGTYAVAKKVDAAFASVEELAANPELAKPGLNTVDWALKTYRGTLPFSNEAIQDAPQLNALLNSTISQYMLNTKNKLISDAIKTATPKAVTNVDELKHIVNVDLDPAYSKVVIASQSAFQFLDTLKDKNDRYLLQDSIASVTGKVILGMPVWVVSDTLLGEAGGANAFVGDAKRFVKLFDRLQATIGWVTNEVYGQQLMGAMRMDAKVADAAAGFFVTFSAPVEP